jgi:hypothetical protein
LQPLFIYTDMIGHTLQRAFGVLGASKTVRIVVGN